MTTCTHISDDRQLLQAYALHRSEQAFREIVDRHGQWVFAAAYRQLGDLQLAQDATQVVFVLLARRAGAMRKEWKISGWLFNTLTYTVNNMRRARHRRLLHERRAALARSEATSAAPSSSDAAGHLDSAVSRLSKTHQAIILLRFYQERSFQEIAGILGISESAAQKRVNRAVGALRKRMGTGAQPASLSAMAALGTGLAPPNFSHQIASVALSAKAGAALPLSIAAATKGTGWLMITTKIQSALLITGTALVFGVPATLAAVHYLGPAPADAQAAAQAANAPQADEAARAAFHKLYALKPGEFVRWIKPPFDDIRAAAYPALAQAYAKDAAQAREEAQKSTVITENSFTTGIQLPTGPGWAFRGGGGGGGGGAGAGGGGGRAGGPGGGGGPLNTGGMIFTPDGTKATLRIDDADQQVPPANMMIGWQDDKPDVLLWRIRDDDGGFTLGNLLGLSFGLPPDRLDGQKDLFEHKIPGDFVVRANATDEQLRGDYEKIFSDFLETPVKLKFDDVETKVVVLKGKWQYTHVEGANDQPPNVVFRSAEATPGDTPTIHLYSSDMSSTYGSGGGTNKTPLFAMPLAMALQMPVAVEAEGIPKRLSYIMHYPWGVKQDAKALLDHITEQTGLKWTLETRKIRHISIEQTK